MRASLPHITEGRFLICDGNTGELFVTKRAEKAEHYHIDCPLHAVALDGQIRKMLIFCHGGFGDMLFLTPSLLWLHETYPHIEINTCGFSNYLTILDSPGLEFVKKVAYPLPESAIEDYDVIVPLEECIKPGFDAVESMAAVLCAEPTNKQPYYRVSDSELTTAQERFPRNSRPRIGVQLKSTAKIRSWTPRHVQQFVNACSLNGWEVFLFGAPNEAQGQMPPHVVNLTSMGLSFRESCAILPSCDAVVAPDSAITHVSGALNIPTLALYGPFLASERVSHSPSIRPLQGHGGCPLAPCNFHQIAGQEFPDDGPCASTGACSEMEALKPSYLIQQVKKILNQ